MCDRSAFFYGTLMVNRILFRVIYGDEQADQDPTKRYLIGQLTFEDALLKDYIRKKATGFDYPGITPEKGCSVKGVFVTGMTDGDIHRLDWFEGDQYERKIIEVELLGKDEKGEPKKAPAEVYVFIERHDLEEEEWSFEEFRRDKLLNWVGKAGEAEYAASDAAAIAAVTEGYKADDQTGARNTSSGYAEAGKEGVEIMS